MSKCKFYKEQKYISYDSGTTWIPTSEYRKGAPIEGYSFDCALEKTIFVIEDAPKPFTYSGQSVSCGAAYTAATMPEGYAKSIQFIDGIYICSVESEGSGCRITRDKASAWKFSSLNGTTSLNIGEAVFYSSDACTDGGCVEYNSYVLDGDRVSSDCYCCCLTHKTCPAWVITEYMPWLEDRSHVKVIYIATYTRATIEDEWTLVSKDFYGEGEKWIAVSETSTTKTFQHQVASVDENYNLVWTNEGNPIPYTKETN